MFMLERKKWVEVIKQNVEDSEWEVHSILQVVHFKILCELKHRAHFRRCVFVRSRVLNFKSQFANCFDSILLYVNVQHVRMKII